MDLKLKIELEKLIVKAPFCFYNEEVSFALRYGTIEEIDHEEHNTIELLQDKISRLETDLEEATDRIDELEAELSNERMLDDIS